MPIYQNTPGVWTNEVRLAPPPIVGVGTSTAAFIGTSPIAGRFTNTPRLVTSLDQFKQDYELDNSTPYDPTRDATRSTALSHAVRGFFANGGQSCYVLNVDAADTATLAAAADKYLAPIDEIAIVAAPGHTEKEIYAALTTHCQNLGDRVAIFDPTSPPASLADVKTPIATPGTGIRPPDTRYAAFYYPRIQVGGVLKTDPATEYVGASGHIAGIYARVDAQRGVHKAPANEVILGALGVEARLTDADQNVLNVEGVNALRLFPSGNVVVWGARTLTSSTAGDKTYLYINIRRLVNYIEESLQDGLSWAVFEPNNLTLQKQIARAARGFLDGVWRDGALFGATPDDAYYVRFPDIYNRDDDRAQGRLTVEIGLRVSYPAEFIIIRIGLLMQSAATA
jgi:uncharacterized protein